MKSISSQEQKKQTYETPKVLASYDKDELDDAIGVNPHVEGQNGSLCGCGCGPIGGCGG